MRNTVLLPLLVLLLKTCPVSLVRGQDSTPAPRSQFDSLVKEFAKAQAEYEKKLERTQDRAAQAKLFRESSPYPEFAGRFLELAKKHAKDDVAYDCLTWIVKNGECGPRCEAP